MFFRLDLSIPWSTSKPMWKSIKNTGLILDTYRTVVSAKYQSIYYLTAMDDDRIIGMIYSVGKLGLIAYNRFNVTMETFVIPNITLASKWFEGKIYNWPRRSMMFIGFFTIRLNYEAETYGTEYLLETKSWANY
ncbi:hypothetical protein BGZ97_000796, partial [Linnemannia gamsii]